MTTQQPKLSAPARVSFTMARLSAIACPAAKSRHYIYDLGCPGLAMAVTPAGGKSFYLVRKLKGRQEKILVGKFPRINVEQARKAVQQFNGQIAQGIDPAEQRRRGRAESTFATLFAFYLEHHAKQRKRTWAEDERKFDVYLKPRWGTRRISTITRPEVVKLHSELGQKHGPYQANRIYALIHKVFAVAIEGGYVSENPAAGIKKYPEQSRERFLSADELKSLFKELATLPDETVRDAILVLLLTGARRGNVFAMKWADLDLPLGHWRVGADESKNKTGMLVPLVPQVIAVIQSRSGNGSEFVFPSSRGDRGHVVELKKSWANVLKNAKLDDVRIHDLRRTLGSWMAAAGASLPIIGRTLGHKSTASTAIYARLQLDSVKAAVGGVAGAMTAGAPVGLLPSIDR